MIYMNFCLHTVRGLCLKRGLRAMRGLCLKRGLRAMRELRPMCQHPRRQRRGLTRVREG